QTWPSHYVTHGGGGCIGGAKGYGNSVKRTVPWLLTKGPYSDNFFRNVDPFDPIFAAWPGTFSRFEKNPEFLLGLTIDDGDDTSSITRPGPDNYVGRYPGNLGLHFGALTAIASSVKA